MAIHFSIRLAWHQNGWNGHVCPEPIKNTYCIGTYSYPGDAIRASRDINYECQNCSKAASSLKSALPCALSINAFGKDTIEAISYPPSWFNKGAKEVKYIMPPATVGTWPYRFMYDEEVKNSAKDGQKYNNETRLKKAKEYFAALEKDKSIIFYASNYSNPFSEEDSNKYVVVGISRLKSIGDLQYYEGVNEELRKKTAGAYAWQMPVTSNYPHEGFCIPYHKYIDNPEVLKKILLVPSNNDNFKYASSPISDDDALTLVEQLLSVVQVLIDIDDETENWEIRKQWLEKLLAELWKDRGPYPGMAGVLGYLDFPEAIEYYKCCCDSGKAKEAYGEIVDFVSSKSKTIKGLYLDNKRVAKIQRDMILKSDVEIEFLIKYIVRFSLNAGQIKKILSDNRSSNCLYTGIEDMVNNPYLLCEQFVGDEPSENISFYLIDHGVIPAPDLGLEEIFDKGSKERFRALCLDVLKQEQKHSFVSAEVVLDFINFKLESFPDWKTHKYVMKNFTVDEEFLSGAIVYRYDTGMKLYLYDKQVYEDEKLINAAFNNLLIRNDIEFRKPVKVSNFKTRLYNEESTLAKKCAKDYEEAVDSQAEQCYKIIFKGLSIITGGAGTGKTAIVKSLIEEIKHLHGSSSETLILAPTGKAADRLRELADTDAKTIHSFLMQQGRLNENNMTYKRCGKACVKDYENIIIDECSMIDLPLFSAFIRAVDWNCVKRLILVGDHNQLPPIGRGKFFSETLEYLKENYPDNVAELKKNLRQLENKVTNSGIGILKLAEIFKADYSEETGEAEIILDELQSELKLSTDLKLDYWTDETDLYEKLKRTIADVLRSESGKRLSGLGTLWGCLSPAKKSTRLIQVLSTFRGETYGVDNLNTILQKEFNNNGINACVVDGIAVNDKVIQYWNRTRSKPVYAYDWDKKQTLQIEVFNGELGYTEECKLGPRINLNVRFDRRKNMTVGYGSKFGKYNKVEENIELAYALSVHRAQGSDFDHIFIVLPKRNSDILSTEMVYTALTRAKKSVTLLVQSDFSTLTFLRRKERAIIPRINSSVYSFKPIPEQMVRLGKWYEEGKIISTLSDYFVRSKSEMNIANILALKDIEFKYEFPLFSSDGTMYLPDFTIKYKGNTYYWEHVSLLNDGYKKHWDKKKAWYDKYFRNQLLVTYEGEDQTQQIRKIFRDIFGEEL